MIDVVQIAGMSFAEAFAIAELRTPAAEHVVDLCASVLEDQIRRLDFTRAGALR